jgi:hypothetical protein
LRRRVQQHQAKGKARLIYYEAYQLEKLAKNQREKIKTLWKRLAGPQEKNNGLEGGVLHSIQHVYRRILIYY